MAVLTTPAVDGDEDRVDAAPGVPDGRPKIHAKQLSLLVSCGTEDRDRTIEEFFGAVKAAIETIANAKRVTLASQYYILDGKVCLPRDYDEDTQNFRPGAAPPPWAGGPVPARRQEAKTPSKVDGALSGALDAVKAAKEAQQ